MNEKTLKLVEEIMKYGLSEPVAKQLAHDHFVLQRTMLIGEIAQMRHAGLTNAQICEIMELDRETMKTLMAENMG